jgi:hypothetical protein
MFILLKGLRDTNKKKMNAKLTHTCWGGLGMLHTWDNMVFIYIKHKDVGRSISKLDQLKEFCCSG